MRRVWSLVLALLLAGCISTPSSLMPPERRALNVPELDPDLHSIPLRVAVHVPRPVLEARTYFERPMEPKFLASRVIGPDVFAAVAKYFPKVFSDARVTTEFPSAKLDPEAIDAVVVVESLISVWASETSYGFSDWPQDAEITLGAYTLDGSLIARVATVGSAALKWESTFDANARMTQAERSAGIAVAPAMRRALMEFPTGDVLVHLAREQHAVRTRMRGAREDAEFWRARKSSFEAAMAKLNARIPADAVDGEAHVRGVVRQAALVAGIAGAVGSAAIAQMPVQSQGQAMLNVMTQTYLDYVMKDDPNYAAAKALATTGLQLFPLGGRKSASGGAALAGGAGPDYCQELRSLAERSDAGRRNLTSLVPLGAPPPAFRPGPGASGGVARPAVLPSGGGGGQAGAFGSAQANYISAYNAVCR